MSTAISAKVLEVTPHRDPSNTLFTMQLRYPRFIHAQVLMHRMFARNAASNRARSIPKPLTYAVTIDFLKKHDLIYYPRPRKRVTGMQVDFNVSSREAEEFTEIWADAAQYAYQTALFLQNKGFAKELVNRLIEPFQMIDVVMTGIDYYWRHFVDLRIRDDAQFEIAQLAAEIAKQIDICKPRSHNVDAEHIPYLTEGERKYLGRYICDDFWASCAVSAARCARVSYTPFNKMKLDLAEDLTLFLKLVRAEPIHASPLEHSARPAAEGEAARSVLPGWVTFRQLWETASEEARRKFCAECENAIKAWRQNSDVQAT